MRALSHDIVGLAHYVELSKAGWWDEAVERYILGVLWQLRSPAPEAQIRAEIRRNVSLDLKAHETKLALSRLETKNKIARLADGRYALHGTTQDELDEHKRTIDEIESAVEDIFCRRVQEACPDLDPAKVWRVFLDKLIVPLVAEEGARLYTFLVGETRSQSPLVPYMQRFLEQLTTAYSSELSNLVMELLRSDDAQIRKFLLYYLDGHFIAAASGLPASVLKRLSVLGTEGLGYSILLDSNFVFSILGLHSNPSNEAANDLMDLIRSVSSTVDIRPVVAPNTLEETVQSIQYHRKKLGRTKYAPSLAEAVIASNETYGIQATFFERVSASGQFISPDDYFAPYEQNLATMLEAKGVEILSGQDMKKYEDSVSVLDDMEELKRHEDEVRGERAKSEEAVKHDVVLWHYVQDKRGWRSVTPLTAEYWIVTVDFRFLSFDRHQTLNGRLSPACMHPSQLIQVLRFFVPKSPTLENTLLAVMRLPVLTRSFSTQEERVCLEIARNLARHEGIEDVPTDTLLRILGDEGLKSRMADRGVSEQEQLDAVDSVLARELADRERRLEQQRVKATELESQANQLRYEVERHAEESGKWKKAAEEMKAQAGVATQQAFSQIQASQEELSRVQNELARTKTRNEQYASVMRGFLGLLVCTLGLLGIVRLPAVWPWLAQHPHRLGLQITGIVMLIALAWVIIDRKRRPYAKIVVFLDIVIAALLAVSQII